MLDFLIDKLPEMGDGEFKMQTWDQVAVHMRSKFPLAEGEGERMAESCRSKFTRYILSANRTLHAVSPGRTTGSSHVWWGGNACWKAEW